MAMVSDESLQAITLRVERGWEEDSGRMRGRRSLSELAWTSKVMVMGNVKEKMSARRYLKARQKA
jgi:hypothetical protein